MWWQYLAGGIGIAIILLCALAWWLIVRDDPYDADSSE